MTTYRNTYAAHTAPIDVDAILRIPPDEYDFNFVFDVGVLRTDRIELRPLVVSDSLHASGDQHRAHVQPSLHAQLLFDGLNKNPETTRWLPLNADKLDDVVINIETRRRDSVSFGSRRAFLRDMLIPRRPCSMPSIPTLPGPIPPQPTR
jgi:hypothetical protein